MAYDLEWFRSRSPKKAVTSPEPAPAPLPPPAPQPVPPPPPEPKPAPAPAPMPASSRRVEWWSAAAQTMRREQLNHLPNLLPEAVTSSPEWRAAPPSGCTEQVTVRGVISWISTRAVDLEIADSVPASEKTARRNLYEAAARREAAERFIVVEAGNLARTVSLTAVERWISGRAGYLAAIDAAPDEGYVPSCGPERLQAEAEAEAVFRAFMRAGLPQI